MVFVFTICFLAYSVLVGHFYEKYNISRNVWIIVCVILTALVVLVFIIDLFFTKHDTDQNKQ